MDITPLDLEVKQGIREFYASLLALERAKNPYAIGVTIRERDSERFVDDLWVFINSRVKKE